MAHFDEHGTAMKSQGLPFARHLGGVPRTTIEDRKQLLKALDPSKLEFLDEVVNSFVQHLKEKNFSNDEIFLSFDLIATRTLKRGKTEFDLKKENEELKKKIAEMMKQLTSKGEQEVDSEEGEPEKVEEKKDDKKDEDKTEEKKAKKGKGVKA